MSALADATIGFGSKAVSNGSGGYTPGLALYENLNYMRAWTRTQAYDEENGGCSGPVVSIRTFDRPQPTVFDDVCLDDNAPVMLDTKTQAGDSTQMIVHNADGDVMRTYLPNGRRQTALVIEDAADAWHWNGGNNPGRVAIEGDDLPGVARHVNFDATGTPTAHLRAPEDEDTPDTYGSDAEELPDGGLTEFICITAEHGLPVTTQIENPATPGGPSAQPMATVPGNAAGSVRAIGPASLSDHGTGVCACRENEPSEPMEEAGVDISTGLMTSWNLGTELDRGAGIMLCGGVPIGSGPGKFGPVLAEGVHTFQLIGGISVRLMKIKGKWYRPYQVRNVTNPDGKKGTQTIWPTPGQATQLDGNVYVPEDYEVDDETWKRYEQVSRGGFCGPKWLVDIIDLAGSILGFNDEIGFLLNAYAKGGIDGEDVATIISGLAAHVIVGTAVGILTAGAGYLMAKVVGKQFFIKAVDALRVKLAKSESGTARDAAKRLDKWLDDLGADKGAHNNAMHEQYLAEMRRRMGKPDVSDTELQDFMERQYRRNATVGSGSTADAVRHEKATGEPVCGLFHSEKAQNSINELVKWLKVHRDNPNISEADRRHAENVLKDLADAIGQ